MHDKYEEHLFAWKIKVLFNWIVCFRPYVVNWSHFLAFVNMKTSFLFGDFGQDI